MNSWMSYPHKLSLSQINLWMSYYLEISLSLIKLWNSYPQKLSLSLINLWKSYPHKIILSLIIFWKSWLALSIVILRNFIPYNVLNSDRLVDVIFPQQIIINYQLSARTISNLSSYQCGPEKTLDEENPTALRFLAAHSERLFNSLQILPWRRRRLRKRRFSGLRLLTVYHEERPSHLKHALFDNILNTIEN